MSLVRWIKRVARRETVAELKAEVAVAEKNLLDMNLDDAYAERDDLLAEIRRLVEDRESKPR